jgi:hypothetical protein
MVDSDVSATFITSRSSERGSGRLRLSSLIPREREKLEKLAMVKLGHAFIGGQGRILDFQDSHLRAGNLIKYLHPHVRFFMDDIDDNYSLEIESSSKKPVKPTSNSELLKIFCGVFIDTIQNKRWKGKNLVYKIRIDNFCFLIILDKKFKKDGTQYHLTDAFGSRIAATNVWFIQGFTTPRSRDKMTERAAQRHTA